MIRPRKFNIDAVNPQPILTSSSTSVVSLMVFLVRDPHQDRRCPWPACPSGVFKAGTVPSFSETQPSVSGSVAITPNAQPARGSAETCPSPQKLPFTIPELVHASPCRSSDGVFYTGKRLSRRRGQVRPGGTGTQVTMGQPGTGQRSGTAPSQATEGRARFPPCRPEAGRLVCGGP